jgi:acyl-CoA thioesterase YciA
MTVIRENPDTYPEDQQPSIRRIMMPRDTNAVGTIFGGVILSEIDLAAAIEAHKHHQGRVVTVSMDKIDFKAPVHVGDLVSVFTETCRIGRTSMTIHAAVWAHRRFGGGEQSYVTSAQITMVAVDENLRPIPVGEGT